MNNMDIWIAVLRLERERQLRYSLEKGRVLRTLDEDPVRTEAANDGAVRRGWQFATRMLHRRRGWPALRRGDSARCAAAADSLV